MLLENLSDNERPRGSLGVFRCVLGDVKESFIGVTRERGYQTQSGQLCIPDHISMQEVCTSLPMHGLLPLFVKRREDMYLLSRTDVSLDVLGMAPYFSDIDRSSVYRRVVRKF